MELYTMSKLSFRRSISGVRVWVTELNSMIFEYSNLVKLRLIPNRSPEKQSVGSLIGGPLQCKSSSSLHNPRIRKTTCLRHSATLCLSVSNSARAVSATLSTNASADWDSGWEAAVIVVAAKGLVKSSWRRLRECGKKLAHPGSSDLIDD